MHWCILVPITTFRFPVFGDCPFFVADKNSMQGSQMYSRQNRNASDEDIGALLLIHIIGAVPKFHSHPTSYSNC